MKCSICKKTVEETFLNKLKGTYIGAGKGKKAVCQACQQQHNMEEIRKKLG